MNKTTFNSVVFMCLSSFAGTVRPNGVFYYVNYHNFNRGKLRTLAAVCRHFCFFGCYNS